MKVGHRHIGKYIAAWVLIGQPLLAFTYTVFSTPDTPLAPESLRGYFCLSDETTAVKEIARRFVCPSKNLGGQS